VRAHCAEIDRCNQRGGRMLSIVDLVAADTLTHEIAAYALACISAGASFMVGAMPGGAGKTTVMGALLNLVPADVTLAPADRAETIQQGLREPTPRRCFICHEIGKGSYYGYLWGADLRAYFQLPGVGHSIATNLHADTFRQARRQVCDQNRVPPDDFARVSLILFLEVEPDGWGYRRRVSAIWESAGSGEHRQVYDGRPGLVARASHLVDPALVDASGHLIAQLTASGAPSIDQVRRRIIDFLTANPRRSP
jgi:hypothetical protein